MSHTIEYFLSPCHFYLWGSNIMKPRIRIKQFHWLCSYTFLWAATNEWTCQTFMTEGHNGAGSKMVIRLLAPYTNYLKWQLWHLQSILKKLFFFYFHFANLENFQLQRSIRLRIFPVIDTFSEASNRLTFKRLCNSHKPQACSIHVSASKETCVSICSQSRIFKMCFFPTVSQAMRCWGDLRHIMARLHNNTTTKDQLIPGTARDPVEIKKKWKKCIFMNI